MHVLYFHQHFSTPEGSTGTRSYEMAQRLIAQGHRVTMVCGSGQLASSGLGGPPANGVRRGTIDGIDVIELCLPYSNYDGLLKRAWTFLRFAWRSSMLALRLDYDLLFATSTPLTAGIPGILMKLLRRKPFVFEVRDLWPELPREMGVITNPAVLKGMDVLEFLSYRLADACIGLSPGIVRGITRRGVAEERVAMVPNGCDLDLFRPDIRSELELPGVASGDLVAIFCGAHGIANGLDAVLDAAKSLKGRGVNDIKILLVGDGKLKPRLRQRAKDEGLENCIFCDPIPKHRLAGLTASVDVGLMILANVPAFYYGTSPNKFFDYVASGLPVLNNYPGWLADIVGEHDCGVAVAPDDPEAFADALLMLRDDPERRKRMGMKARELAESRFDRADLADQLVKFLESCQRKYDKR